jgi:hypothetical protein
MRISWALCIIGLCTLMTGCQLGTNAICNLTYEAKLATGECQEKCRYQKLAKSHWEAIRQDEPPCTFSKDYAEGFKEGFTDYLLFGGSGQAPYVPPKRYWGVRFRTPDGARAIDEWFAGFRHGAHVAQQTGYRQWATVPSAAGQLGPAEHELVPGMTSAAPRNVPMVSHRLPQPTSPPLVKMPADSGRLPEPTSPPLVTMPVDSDRLPPTSPPLVRMPPDSGQLPPLTSPPLVKSPPDSGRQPMPTSPPLVKTPSVSGPNVAAVAKRMPVGDSSIVEFPVAAQPAQASAGSNRVGSQSVLFEKTGARNRVLLSPVTTGIQDDGHATPTRPEDRPSLPLASVSTPNGGLAMFGAPKAAPGPRLPNLLPAEGSALRRSYDGTTASGTLHVFPAAPVSATSGVKEMDIHELSPR